MATLEEGIEFTGSLGNLSAYRMKGSDKIILRRKGGPKKDQILNSERFERTRDNMTEFSGVGKAVKAIRSPLLHVKQLSEHNFTSQLISICKKIQLLDTIGERGQRGIFLSQHRYILAGFRLNKKHPFINIVMGPVGCVIHRDTKTAIIELPRLIPGINLSIPWKQPFYRFCMSFGLVPDIVYESNGYNNHMDEWADTKLETAWHRATETFESLTVELRLDVQGTLKDSQTLIFAIGIEMGAPSLYGGIEAVQYAGSAYIQALG
jgi:hypothetical protein